MAEKMNSMMEKLFFHHILSNIRQFEFVEPSFFKNDNIRFIYSLIREDYLKSDIKEAPSREKILMLIRLNDSENKISDSFIKELLKNTNDKIGEEWIKNKFRSWKMYNIITNSLLKGIDNIRNINPLEIDEINNTIFKFKELFNFSELMSMDEDDGDLGVDFDEIDSHIMDKRNEYIPTGWASLDYIMEGGWDKSSLNVLMGETNVGKSMWMQNIAVKLANQGYNVAYVTLEMSAYKCIKRMGAMRLKIPIKEYSEKAKDPIYMKNKLNSLKQLNGALLGAKLGKILVKKYNTKDCTVTDLDNYIKRVRDIKNINLDVLIVDYLNIMSIEKGLDIENMLYLKGKHLSEGLRHLADKYNLCVITATQVEKDVWSSNNIDLRNVPESKAIVETADSVWAIIRNPKMRVENLYKLKVLKLRDHEHSNQMIKFTFDPEYLIIDNDEFVV